MAIVLVGETRSTSFPFPRRPPVVAELGFAVIQPERTTVPHDDAVSFDLCKQHFIQASALVDQGTHALEIAVVTNGIKEGAVREP